MRIIRVGRGRSSPKGVRAYYGNIMGKITYIFRAWRLAERLHKEKPFAATWGMMASYGSIAALFFKLRHPKIPFVLTIQEGDSERHLRFGKVGLVGIAWSVGIRMANHIQVISTYLKEFVLRRGAKAPITVVPNGVDLAVFQKEYSPEEQTKLVEKLGITNEYVVITTSRLVEKNAVDILIEAIGKVIERGIRIKCIVVGDGPDRKKLERLAALRGIKGSVVFVGQLSQGLLPLYLRISDLFVRVSRSEGLGISFLEAMAAGVPVIGTPVGGITDFLEDGKTGWAVPVNNSEVLAEKIYYSIQHREARKKIAVDAQKLIRSRYTWDYVAESIDVIFQSVISNT